MMKTLRFFVPVLMLLAFSACNKEGQDFRMQTAPECKSNEFSPNVRPLKIAVLSDVHFMDPSLLK